MKRYAIIGAAGYIAPRHMRAIKDTGGEIVAALDPHDSVGVLDSYFPDAHFFTEPERFDRHLDKLRRSGEGVDYVTICSPNYLHDAHIRMALRNGADVICEKPLVLNKRNALALQELEAETGRRVNVILQMRLIPELINLRANIDRDISRTVTVEYLTPRGRWYDISWKGNAEKSGGVATNIGVHLFDMLAWVFGEAHTMNISRNDDRTCRGAIHFGGTLVSFHLSILQDHAPKREMRIYNHVLNFGKAFTGLHSESYRQILDGHGFGIDDALPGISITETIRAL